MTELREFREKLEQTVAAIGRSTVVREAVEAMQADIRDLLASIRGERG